MTIIIRKENLLVTDSLIFNGSPGGVSIEYENKIKRNKAGTVIIVSSSNTFKGNFNSILETCSNIIINNILENKEITLASFPEEFHQVILNKMEEKEDLCIMFCTKYKSYLIQVFSDKPLLLTYDYNELVYIGSGSSFLISQNLKNTNIIDLIQKVINNSSTCNGDINTFDLNSLKDIVL